MTGSIWCPYSTPNFCAKVEFSLVELGRTNQYLDERPRYGHKEVSQASPRLLWCSWWEVLVNVCLHSIMEEYKIFFENLSFPSFSRLMEVALCTNKLVRRSQGLALLQFVQASCPSTTKEMSDRRASWKRNRVQASSSKRPPFDKKEPR